MAGLGGTRAIVLDSACSVGTDQRGFLRPAPAGGAFDIGAFELGANPPPPYAAQVQQPINPDGSSVFKAKRGVVPVKVHNHPGWHRNLPVAPGNHFTQ